MRVPYTRARARAGVGLRGTRAALEYFGIPSGSKPVIALRGAANGSHRSTRSGSSRRTIAAVVASVDRCPWSTSCAEQLRVREPPGAQTRCFVSPALLGVAIGKRPASLCTGQTAHTRFASRLVGARYSLCVASAFYPSLDRVRSARGLEWA